MKIYIVELDEPYSGLDGLRIFGSKREAKTYANSMHNSTINMLNVTNGTQTLYLVVTKECYEGESIQKIFYTKTAASEYVNNTRINAEFLILEKTVE